MTSKRRNGLMGEVSSGSKAIKNAVNQRGTHHSENAGAAIKNAVAMKPCAAGLQGIANSVTKPNAH